MQKFVHGGIYGGGGVRQCSEWCARRNSACHLVYMELASSFAQQASSVPQADSCFCHQKERSINMFFPNAHYGKHRRRPARQPTNHQRTQGEHT